MTNPVKVTSEGTNQTKTEEGSSTTDFTKLDSSKEHNPPYSVKSTPSTNPSELNKLDPNDGKGKPTAGGHKPSVTVMTDTKLMESPVSGKTVMIETSTDDGHELKKLRIREVLKQYGMDSQQQLKAFAELMLILNW